MSEKNSNLVNLRLLSDIVLNSVQKIEYALSNGDKHTLAHEDSILVLQEIEDVFRFIHQEALAGLVQIIREILVKLPNENDSSPAANLLASVCAKLVCFLVCVRSGQRVMAYQLMSLWRLLAEHWPKTAITPASLLALDMLPVGVDIGIPDFILEDVLEKSVSNKEIEHALLELIREDPGTEKFSNASKIIGIAISDISLNHPESRQRYFWMTARVHLRCIQLHADLDLPKAKKIVSSVVHMLRQRTATTWPNLPDALVRETLFQLSVSTADSVNQFARAWFALDAQLRGPVTEWENLPDSRDINALLNDLDNFLATISLPDKQDGQDKLLMLAGKMQTIPFLLKFKEVLFECSQRYQDNDDLAVTVGVMSIRECLARYLNHSDFQIVADHVFFLLDEILNNSSANELYSDKKNLYINRLNYVLLRPGAIAALKSTIVSSLTTAEPQLDVLLSKGDRLSAAKLMNEVLSDVNPPLVFMGDSQGVSMVDSLIQAIQQQLTLASEMSEADSSSLIQAWVELGLHVETVFSNLSEVSDLPPYLIESAVVIPANAVRAVSTDPTLREIFVLEASERLSILRDQVTLFAEGITETLPSQSAIEIHALAGSSATVGNVVMQQQALALENLVNRVIALAVGEQITFLPELLHCLVTLEQQFYADYGKRDQETTLHFKANQQANQRANQQANEDAVSESEATENAVIENAVIENAVTENLTIKDGLHAALKPDFDYAEIALQNTASEFSIYTSPLSETTLAQPLDLASTLPELPVASDTDQPYDSVDPELRLIFNEEAAELMPQLATLLEQWLQTPEDPSFAAALLRLLHTLKGSARMAGEIDLGESLHELEHRVSQLAQQKPVQLAEITVLQQDVHYLLVSFGLLSEDTPQTPLVSEYVAADKTSTVLDQPSTKSPAAPTKLRIDLLERATGSAAELLVHAMRATEQVSEQKQLISDLGENLARLRTQLRELELQSEASISSHSFTNAAGFDPLEFDRFTRLQELTRMTAESMADLADVQRSLTLQTDTSLTILVAQTRHARALQSDLHRASMQVFSTVEIRFRQLVRQVASEVGRDVRFELEGATIEIDRVVLEKLNAPLSHLIRNAIVHGIEPAEERASMAKPRQGQLRIKLSDHGNEFRLQISDDGRGLNFVRIREHAITNGLLAAGTEPDTDFLTQLIFEPGFSTAEQVTGLAGRGIGMDAVKAAVIDLGGALKIDTRSGLGTTLTIALPKSSSTQQIIQVAEGRQPIALPTIMVQQVVHITAVRAKQVLQEGVFDWQDKKIPACSLSDLIQEPVDALPAVGRMSMLILNQLDQWLAVKVNEVHGHHEVIVKQPGIQLKGMPGLMGAALLPDGDVLLVLNLLQLHAHAGASSTYKTALAARGTATTLTPAVTPPLVMVVDDSLTVRRVSQRMLEKYGYTVALARHGAEALDMLRERTPVAILLDIEMPTMDGFELLGRLRTDEQFHSLPVAMITSRMAERHREHAMQLGANAYFGKPYREQEIVEWLAQWIPANTSSGQLTQFDKNLSLHAAA